MLFRSAKVLNLFSKLNLNLTKIQSVPIIGKPYEYKFHIDMEWIDYVDFRRAIEEINQFTTSVKVIGEYKKGTFKLEA